MNSLYPYCRVLTAIMLILLSGSFQKLNAFDGEEEVLSEKKVSESELLSSDSIANNDSTDSLSRWYQKGLVGKAVDYFGNSNQKPITSRPSFSFIGGPHYSSDTGFGIGLVAAALYSTSPSDTTIKVSNISLCADVTTGGFFKLGVTGMHIYHGGNRRIEYELSAESYCTYFWGVGYRRASDDKNKTKYQLLDIKLEGFHLWRISDSQVFIGPMVRLDYIASLNNHDEPVWYGMPKKFADLGVGARVQFDTRDNYTAPNSGWLLQLDQRFFPRFLGNASHNFSQTELSVNKYMKVWNGGLLAMRWHGNFTYGDTPWGLMPTLGGSCIMRGYYEGQYRDKCETDIVAELRQHVWRRSGVAMWGGVGAVFPSLSDFSTRHLLPTYGVGYRWEFKKNTNVRVDVGFGKDCWGVVLSINEAF